MSQEVCGDRSEHRPDQGRESRRGDAEDDQYNSERASRQRWLPKARAFWRPTRFGTAAPAARPAAVGARTSPSMQPRSGRRSRSGAVVPQPTTEGRRDSCRSCKAKRRQRMVRYDGAPASPAGGCWTCPCPSSCGHGRDPRGSDAGSGELPDRGEGLGARMTLKEVFDILDANDDVCARQLLLKKGEVFYLFLKEVGLDRHLDPGDIKITPEAFAEADLNGDGKLSGAEFIEAPSASSTRRQERRRGGHLRGVPRLRAALSAVKILSRLARMLDAGQAPAGAQALGGSASRTGVRSRMRRWRHGAGSDERLAAGQHGVRTTGPAATRLPLSANTLTRSGQ